MTFSTRKPEDIDAQLQSLKKLIEFFRKECGVYAYLIYGTFLGTIRNNDVISYDNDYDIAYMSKEKNVQDVRKELLKISKILLKYEMLGKTWIKKSGIKFPKELDLNENFSGQMHVQTPDHFLYIDVFTSWIENGKYYLCPHIYGELDQTDIAPYIAGNLRNVSFPIPANPDKVLTELYGETWNIPLKGTKSSKTKKWLCDYE